MHPWGLGRGYGALGGAALSPVWFSVRCRAAVECVLPSLCVSRLVVAKLCRTLRCQNNLLRFLPSAVCSALARASSAAPTCMFSLTARFRASVKYTAFHPRVLRRFVSS